MTARPNKGVADRMRAIRPLAVQKYLDGYPIQAIVDEFGIAKSTLREWTTASGAPKRCRRKARGYDPVKVARIVEMAVVERVPSKVIAQMFGYSDYRHVCRIVRMEGYAMPDQYRRGS